MNVAIYDLETGNVLRLLSTPAAGWNPDDGDVEEGEGFLWVPDDAVVRGKRIVGGQLRDALPLPSDIRILHAQAGATLERLVGDERRRYITIIPGQELVYAEKAREARAWVEAGMPDAADDYPNIAGSAEGSGVTFLVEAQAVIDKTALWAAVSKDIERRRGAATKALREAVTPTEIEAAIALYQNETPE